MSWQRTHLCTGILERDGHLLLVASRYPNHPDALWNLPGGRQEPLESVPAAVAREFLEETSLAVRVGDLAYVAESYDHAAMTHYTNFAFYVSAKGEPVVPADDHAVACAWVSREELAVRLAVSVVREPLLAHLADPARRFFSYADSGITIAFADRRKTNPFR